MTGRVYSRKIKGGTTWAIDYTEPGGRRVRQIIGPSKTLANEVLTARLGDVVRGTNKLAPKKAPRVREFREEYLATIKASGRFWRRHAVSLKRLAVFFGDIALDKIRLSDLVRYRNERQRKVGPATVNRELACLRHMFNTAKRMG
ncbi:MAG: hypothetical protein A2V67_12640 [Deltaproteobacteria bacterium RBG_13_61_14]|nr:MAG: hypothetical protein A2V67_12640 [Deltaproteobacteria bacterium RBG_13_61_14]